MKRHSRLPRDARQAEGHRRGGRRDTRSHARGHRNGGDGRGQARLRAEATHVVRGRGATLAAKAKQKKVATQMGNQGHSWDDGRRAVEWIQAGAIGDVREVHVWTNRPLAYWPQGIPRPQPQRIATELRWNMPGVMARLANAMGLYSVPDKLAVGPVPRPGAARSSITPSITRSIGAGGRTGASAQSATWARTSSITPSGRSISAIRRASKPSRRRSTSRASRWPRRPTTSSRRAGRCRR